jgi:hypothetical protein
MNSQPEAAFIHAMKRFFSRDRACTQSAFWLRLFRWATRRAHA